MGNACCVGYRSDSKGKNKENSDDNSPTNKPLK